MRVPLRLIGVFLLFVGGTAMALGGDTGVPEIGIAASLVLLVAVPLGAYLFVIGGQRGPKRGSGKGMPLGQALAYAAAVMLLVPGTALTGLGVHDLLIQTLVRGRANEWTGLYAMTLPLGALLACAGMAVLIAAGQIGAVPPRDG